MVTATLTTLTLTALELITSTTTKSNQEIEKLSVKI